MSKSEFSNLYPYYYHNNYEECKYSSYYTYYYDNDYKDYQLKEVFKLPFNKELIEVQKEIEQEENKPNSFYNLHENQHEELDNLKEKRNKLIYGNYIEYYGNDIHYNLDNIDEIKEFYENLPKHSSLPENYKNDPIFMYELITINNKFIYCLSDELKENEYFLYALFDLITADRLNSYSVQNYDQKREINIPKLYYFFTNCISEKFRNNERFINNLRIIRKNGIGAINNPPNNYKELEYYEDLSDKFIDKSEDEIINTILNDKMIKEYRPFDNLTNILLSLPIGLNYEEFFKKLLIKVSKKQKYDVNEFLELLHNEKILIKDKEFSKIIIKEMINKYDITREEGLYDLFNQVKDDEEFVYELINSNIDRFVKSRNKKLLTEKQFKYLLDLAKSKGILLSINYYDNFIEYVSLRNGSDLVNKLRNKYGKSYEKYATKNNIDINNNSHFLYKMFTSNVLEDILSNDYYSENDVLTVKSFINYFKDFTDYNVNNLYEKINLLGKKYAIIALKETTTILNANPENESFKELLSSHGYTKDNFFKKVCNNKYLDKKLKEALLIKIGSFYKTNIITAFDIMDIMLEMNERKLTINQILSEKKIAKNFFDRVYKESKENNPILYNYIQSLLKENSIRGFKKLLRLYYSLMNFNENNYEEFINKYNEEPEVIIEKFKNTPLYEDVYNKLITIKKEKGLK